MRLRYKSKIFLTLCTLTLFVLSLSTIVAVKDFQVDKTQQVFEFGLNQNRSLSLHLQREVLSQQSTFSKIFRGFHDKKLSKLSKYFFSTDKRLLQLWVYSLEKSGQPQQQLHIEKIPVKGISDTDLKNLAQGAFLNSLAIKPLASDDNRWLLGLRMESTSREAPSVLVGLISDSTFFELLKSNDISQTFLINSKGSVLVGSEKGLIESSSFWPKLVKRMDGSLSATMSFQFESEEAWFVSATKLGFDDLLVVTLTDKEVALAPVRFIIAKMLVACFLLILVTLLLSFFVSKGLTKNLKKLISATREVRGGNFGSIVDISSGDEMGELAEDFNKMTGEICRLMEETAEKGRMGAELEMARTVQANLFPGEDYEDDDIEISGFYQPASECGGDWWFYSNVGHKTYLWIGDATGHGASAALVTSAAKSAAYIAQQDPNISLDRILFLMNNAIYETTHGKVNMTFMLSCYDHEKGTLSYSRASHDPPYFMSAEKKPISKRDIIPLFKTAGRRLGEQPNSEYEVHTMDINPGDRILFITDGVTELFNPEKEMYGERKLLKMLVKSFNGNTSLPETRSMIFGELEKFRCDEPLHDDVTYVLFEMKSSDQAA